MSRILHFFCRKFELEIPPVSSSSMTSTTLEVIVLIGGDRNSFMREFIDAHYVCCVCVRFSGAEVPWRSSSSTLMTTIRPFRYNESVLFSPFLHRHCPRRPLDWYSRHHPTVLPLLFAPRMNCREKGTAANLNRKWHESLQVAQFVSGMRPVLKSLLKLKNYLIKTSISM